MSAYFTADARPVLSVLDAAELRAEPSALVRGGMIAIFASPGLFNVLAKYDDASTAADDGTTVWKPDDKGVLDPGRWVVFGAEMGAHTYVKRKVDGSIDGLTADFSNPFVRVNYDVGANDPVPATLCGISVDRGAIAGVERDRAALVWDEPGQAWRVVFTTTNDTVVGTPYIPLVAGGFYTPGGSAATSGVLRVRQDEALTALIGAATYELVKGDSTGSVATFGDVAVPKWLGHADGEVRLRSANGDAIVHARQLSVYDAAGANQLVDASVTGNRWRVLGDLEAYNGASPIFAVDVSASLASLTGLLRFLNATSGVSTDLTLASTPQTTDATATTVATIPVPASGSVGVLVYVKGTQSDGSNGFQQLCINSARRSGAGAPALSQGASGIVIATPENTYAIVKPSFQFVISGNNLLLQVVGKAATTINWLPYYLMISR